MDDLVYITIWQVKLPFMAISIETPTLEVSIGE
jgi:hypothetical protein